MLTTEDIKQIGAVVEEKIADLAGSVQRGFLDVHEDIERVEERLGGVEGRLDGVEGRLDGVAQRMDGIEQRTIRIEATMVTKDYLDEKLADLRGDLNVLIRKEDTKVVRLIAMLRSKKLLADNEANELLGMEPFAKMITS